MTKEHRAFRWTTSALWVVHGAWILAHQIERVLIGEAVIGLAELAAAVLITRGGRISDLVATAIAIGSGLLALVYLTKTPIEVDAYSLMAIISIVALLFTVAVTLWAFLRPSIVESPSSHRRH